MNIIIWLKYILTRNERFKRLEFHFTLVELKKISNKLIKIKNRKLT